MSLGKGSDRQFLRFSFPCRNLEPSWLNFDAGHDSRIQRSIDLRKTDTGSVSKTRTICLSTGTCEKSGTKQPSGVETPSAIRSPKDRAIGRQTFPKPERRPDGTVRQTLSFSKQCSPVFARNIPSTILNRIEIDPHRKIHVR